MSSRKLQAHDFIKRYFAAWGHSPTLGELGAELGVSKQRAYSLVQALSDEKMIEVIAGKTRGIRLIDKGDELSEADILVRAAMLGYTVLHGSRVLQAPAGGVLPLLDVPLTEKGLPSIPVLDYPADAGASPASGTGKHGSTQGEGPRAR